MSVQIGIAEVQRMGYLKIHRALATTDIPVKMKEFFTATCNFKLQPYSELKYWDNIKSFEIECSGINNLITFLCPMINYQEVTEADKRKFRGTWNGIIKGYSKACNLTDSQSEILSDVGLKLPLAWSSALVYSENEHVAVRGEDLADLSWFYNSLLNWYVAVNSESHVDMNYDVDLTEIINVLASYDSSQFMDSMSRDDLNSLLGDLRWDSYKA